MIRRKIVTYVVCMLMITTVFVVLNNQQTRAAIPSGNLDYNYIYNKLAELADIATDHENGKDHDSQIFKGREFGSYGGSFASDEIEEWMGYITNNLSDIADVTIVQEPVGYFRTLPDSFLPRHPYIQAFNLEFKNGTSQAFEFPINETYPMINWAPIRNYDTDGFVKLENYGPNEASSFPLEDDESFSYLAIPYIQLNDSEEGFFSNLTYIQDYENATENDTYGKIHLINPSDEEYNDTVALVANSNGSAFILMRDNISNIINYTNPIPGVAVSTEKGNLLKNLTQDANLSVYVSTPLIGLDEVTQTGNLWVFYTNSSISSQGENKILVVDQKFINPLYKARNFIFLLNLLSKKVKGVFYYDSSISDKTHMQQVPYYFEPGTFYNYGKIRNQPPLISIYAKPIIFINRTILDNTGHPHNIDDWVDDYYTKAKFQLNWITHINESGWNVWCDIKKDNLEGTIVISGGHFDGFWGQSAGDDASGVATMLGILKYLNDHPTIKLKHNIKFITFDGEESIWKGSRGYVLKHDTEVKDDIECMINADVLAHDISSSTLYVKTCINGTTEEINNIRQQTYDIVRWIAKATRYNQSFEDRSYYLKILKPDGHKLGEDVEQNIPISDAVPFYYSGIKTIDFGKEPFEPYYHSTGNDHTLGDTKNIIDREDLNKTADLFWNITKYYCINPDCKFYSVSYQPEDTDGNGSHDAIKATMYFDISLPKDQVMVEGQLIRASGTLSPPYTFSRKFNYTISSPITPQTITVPLPPGKTEGNYYLKLFLYNSTGKINKILNIGTNQYNDTNSSYPDVFYLYPRSNQPPNKPATPTGPTSLRVGDVGFFESQTTDPNNDRMRYQWNWSDSITGTEDYYLSGETCDASHVYHKAGKKYIRVRAIDEFNSASDWSDPLTVTIHFKMQIIPHGDIVHTIPNDDFNLTGSVVGGGGQQVISYNWSFGESNYNNSQSTKYQYPQPGNYTIWLNATDSENNSIYGNKSMTVTVVLLYADFNTSYSLGAPPYRKLYFNDTSDGVNEIVNWTWDFDDTTMAYTQNTTHYFNYSGVYNVTLTVTDDESNTSTTYRLIKISSYPALPTIDYVQSETFLHQGENVTILAIVNGSERSITNVTINITSPNGTYYNHTMNHLVDTLYEYTFTNTSKHGQYNYTIWVKDEANQTITASGYTFKVIVDAMMTLQTLQDSYGSDEYINLTDPPGNDSQEPDSYTITGDHVIWENTLAKLDVYPHTSTSLIHQTQYATITWKQPDTTIDVACRYTTPIANPRIWIWRNTSHHVQTPDYGYLNNTYTIANITGYTVLTIEPECVDFGDIPSTRYLNITTTTSPLHDLLGRDWIICGYDTKHQLDETTCSFTYTYLGVTGYHDEEHYWYDWESLDNVFHHTTYNNKEYYTATNLMVRQNTTYRFKWQYDVPVNSHGKWELLGKLHSDTLGEALATGRYVMIDPWWNTTWMYRKLITIDHSKVSADLTNFPVLVSESSDSDLAAHAQDDGDDIAFVLYSDNTTRMNHEIESFNGSTGELSAWVNVTSLSSTSDTKIWMYYGNAMCNSQQNPTGVWDGNYVGVWHFNEGGTGTRYDSTSYNNDGTPIRYNGDESTTGKIASADSFDGTSTSNYINVSSANSLNITGSLTEEMWIKPDSSQGTNAGIVAKRCPYSSENSNPWNLYTTAFDASTPRKLVFGISAGTSGSQKTVSSTTTLTTIANTWTYVAGRYNQTHISIYINGTWQANTATTLTIGTVNRPLHIGGTCPAATGQFYHGVLDELRVSKNARSDAWIQTDYNAMNSPGTFLGFGGEEIVIRPPVITNPVPTDGCTGASVVPPQMNISVNDPWGQKMTVKWLTNLSSPFIFRPDGNGSTTQLSPNGETDNWQCVDDVVPDGLDTYVYHGSIPYQTWNFDTYRMENHTTQSFGIYNVTAHIRAYNGWTDNVPWPPSYLKITIRTHNVNYNSTVTYSPPFDSTWYDYQYSWTVNPQTGNAWTWGEIDDMEIGVAIYWAGACTQVYAEVNPAGNGWYEYGRNFTSTMPYNGTYRQTGNIFDSWSTTYWWKVQVNDSSDMNTSDVFWFFTGKQSKIVNTGSTTIAGYLLMQVQYYNTSLQQWVVVNDTVNETTPRSINAGQQLALDTLFNDHVNTSDLIASHGCGTYRVYAAFRDQDGDILLGAYGLKLEATWEFMITEN